jgi:hypothetical protein
MSSDRDVVVSEASILIDSILYRPTIYRMGTDFFRTLGIPILHGRDFTEGDAANGAIILDQLGAKRLFPDGSPLGRLVKLGSMSSPAPWMTVVGVARNAVHGLPPVAELDPPIVLYVATPPKGILLQFAVRSDPSVRDIRRLATGALKSILLQSRRNRDPLPPLPSFDGGGALVDIADRDALYQAMEGR